MVPGSSAAKRRDPPPVRYFAYLLGQVLSFFLLKLGLGPRHSTVVVIDGRAARVRGSMTVLSASSPAGVWLMNDPIWRIAEMAPVFGRKAVTIPARMVQASVEIAIGHFRRQAPSTFGCGSSLSGTKEDGP